ncbi:MAG: hypothetical protein ACOYXS_01340 [Chloroflexota bacterium]
MRVRIFELRLIAAGLTALWAVAAGLVLLGYRPGGPVDLLVGIAAGLPLPVAIAALIWPPAARGDRAFALIAWIGLGAGLLLAPSIGGVLNQVLARGPQTLLPSLEAAYPWFLSLAATALFAGLGIARRVRGATALRRDRLVVAVAFAIGSTTLISATFAAAAIANDLALRDAPAISSRFGPTATDVDPPACEAQIRAGRAARLHLELDGDVDRRPIGSAILDGLRSGNDFRWTAEVATGLVLGHAGAARIGSSAWQLDPRRSWRAVPAEAVSGQDLDLQLLATILSAGRRAAAENRGLEYVEGARARHCRIAVDGPTFAAGIPQVRWLAGASDLRRWRGQLDFWVFADGELGRAEGAVSGEAGALGAEGLVGTIRIRLTAVDRDRTITVDAPR